MSRGDDIKRAAEAEREYSASILTAGLAFIKRGHPVLPLWPFQKIPMTKDGFKSATTDPSVLREWHDRTPLMGIGIRTDDITIADLDTKTKEGVRYVGDETFAALIKGHEEVLNTLTSRTWSGGSHYWYAGNAGRSSGGLGLNVDICGGPRGYIIPPPVRIHAFDPKLTLPEPCPAPLQCRRGECEDLATCEHLESLCKHPILCPYTHAYEWVTPLDEWRDLPPWPQLFVDRAEAVKKERRAALRPTRASTKLIPIGGRNEPLHRYLSALRGKGMDDVEAAVDQAMRDFVPRCEGTIERATVLEMATRVFAEYPKGQPQAARGGEGNGGGGESLAKQYLAVFDEAEATLCHEQDDIEIVRLQHKGAFQTHKIISRSFRKILQYHIYKAGLPPSKTALDIALETLTARALHDGEVVQTFNRIAGDGKEWIEIDLGPPIDHLGPPRWKSAFFHKDAETWVIGPHRSAFLRSKSMQGYPDLPKDLTDLTGDQRPRLFELRFFVQHIYSENHWALFLAFLVQGLFPSNTSYVPLVLHGLRGTAKSTISGYCTDLLDPSSIKTRRLPRKPEDLPAAAESSHFLPFDQIDRLPVWMSEDFSSLATGGSFGGRKLYEDMEELVKHFKRVLLLSGIGVEKGLKGDLAERSYAIRVNKFKKGQRMDEDDLEAAWLAARPRITVALFDAVLYALKHKGLISKSITSDFRMMHSASIAIACEPLFGVEEGTVLKALREQKRENLSGELDGRSRSRRPA